jgi:FKBP-type peptidyl-prolyl cis-trans isomerase
MTDVSGDGGVLLAVTTEGTGAQPSAGQYVFAHYTGKLEDGSVFDSSKTKPHRKDVGFYFPLGAGAVIKGWDVAFAAMKVGSKATVTIRSDYGYGDRGTQGIPPRATLVFDVELLDARTCSDEEIAEIDERVARLRG